MHWFSNCFLMLEEHYLNRVYRSMLCINIRLQLKCKFLFVASTVLQFYYYLDKVCVTVLTVSA